MARGREVVAESQKVNLVVQMSIVKDPVYSENPALLEAFKADSERQDQRLLSQQRTLEQQAADLKRQSAEIEERHRSMLRTLLIALTLLVVLIGLAGIVVTHRVAGPIYKMKRQIREVASGRLPRLSRLRKGDELVDFFEAFETMVASLRGRKERELGQLEHALASLEATASSKDLEPLRQLREEMRAGLET